MTLLDLVNACAQRLQDAGVSFGHGTLNAHDEAAWLVLWRLGLPLDTEIDERPVAPEQQAQLQSLIDERIRTRKPAAYLTREAWLGEYRFYVDERVIVPRSFIAELLPEALEPWIEYPELVHRALDMCTGSGCLAVLLADLYPDADVDAVDLSADALAVAQINVEQYGLQERIELIQSDLFSALAGREYDLIISNPPYVDAPSVAALPEEYLREPALALGSGEDGLDATREILRRAPAHLSEHGVLVVEIGHNREALEASFPELPFTWLPTASGDGFVFLLTRDELLAAQAA